MLGTTVGFDLRLTAPGADIGRFELLATLRWDAIGDRDTQHLRR